MGGLDCGIDGRTCFVGFWGSDGDVGVLVGLGLGDEDLPGGTDGARDWSIDEKILIVNSCDS